MGCEGLLRFPLRTRAVEEIASGPAPTDMTFPAPEESDGLVLALHSCSDVFGVGLQPLHNGSAEAPTAALKTFPLGRELSCRLLECVETVLPAGKWPRLARLAVATGPGGFTGTRLSVVLARTLAQQLQLPLDGISSFLLMAHRHWNGGLGLGSAPFWLVQDLPRRGVVAGMYQPDPQALGGMVERQTPRLFPHLDDLRARAACPLVPAKIQLPNDLSALLCLSQAAAATGTAAPWQLVLPIYPTSPVGKV